MRMIPLRRRLFALAAAAILPLAAISGIALWALVRQQHVQAERATLELARALATGVDAELRRSISVLETLATSPVLEAGDMKAFYERSQRVVGTRPFWNSVNLADPSGKVLMNTASPYGAALSPLLGRLKRALERSVPQTDVSFSVGVACFHSDTDDPNALTGLADARLYAAKSAMEYR